LEQRLRRDGLRPPRILVKRDDLLGLALGGNKIRNLEFSIGEALARGATDVISVGRAQSNHCRLTAAACAKAGLRAHIVMSGMRPVSATGNLLLSELFGARIQFTGSDDRAVREGMALALKEEIEARAGRVHMLPAGGSDAIGAIGHAVAALELLTQLRAVGAAVTIVFATATGGTQAGLLAGFQRCAADDVSVLAFSVQRAAEEASKIVFDLAQEAAKRIGAGEVARSKVAVDDSQLGAGYGVPTDAGREALALLARTEGLLLDQVYTAKAFAGLLQGVREGRWSAGDTLVFVHTGGTPGLFAGADATLP
jgi:1-aminocyclopropane-1-carboxylate deaminase/D-cysteine desulfhydrase-like pyridoxal-dependent ACC family enzyme